MCIFFHKWYIDVKNIEDEETIPPLFHEIFNLEYQKWYILIFKNRTTWNSTNNFLFVAYNYDIVGHVCPIQPFLPKPEKLNHIVLPIQLILLPL